MHRRKDQKPTSRSHRIKHRSVFESGQPIFVTNPLWTSVVFESKRARSEKMQAAANILSDTYRAFGVQQKDIDRTLGYVLAPNLSRSAMTRIISLTTEFLTGDSDNIQGLRNPRARGIYSRIAEGFAQRYDYYED